MIGTETITVIPQGPAIRTDGKYSLDPQATYTVKGSIQPAGPAVIAQLSDLARRSAAFVMFVEGTAPAIELADPATRRPSDRVTRAGKTYVVLKELDFTPHTTGLPHKQYVIQEVGSDE